MNLCLSVFTLCSVILTVLCVEDPVRINVYYQSTDKESMNFITQQLHPTYIELNKGYNRRDNRIIARLIPYEDADDQAALTSKCSGQPTRCLINKIHACSVSRLETDWKSLNYVACLLTLTHAKAKECANLTCNDISTMPYCVNTIDGDELLTANSVEAKKLKDVPMKSFPVVTFNGEYKEAYQARARTNLLALLCDKFKAAFEGYCNTPRANRTMSHANYGTNYYFPVTWQCFNPSF